MWVDLDLAQTQALPTRKHDKEESSTRNAAQVEGVRVRERPVLRRDGSVVVRVACRIVRSIAVTYPDLEAVEASLAAICSSPDFASSNRRLVAKVDSPPWNRIIPCISTESRCSISVTETVQQSIVGPGSWKARRYCCGLGNWAGLFLVDATSPGKIFACEVWPRM